MAGFPSWFENNWSSVVGALGIIGSLLLTMSAARREAKSREIENLLTLSDHHREVWNSLRERPELDRILRTDADVLAKPITAAEEESVNLVMVQYLTAWRVAKAGGIVTLEELAADARGFFSLPLPQAVWKRTRSTRNPKFVRFVDRAITGKTRNHECNLDEEGCQ